MLKRILVAVVFIPLIFVLFFVAPPWCLPIVTAAISMIAVHEVLWSTGFVKNVRISCYSIILAGLIPIWVFFGGGLYIALAGILVYVVLLFLEAISSHYTVTMEKMGGAFFFSVIIPMFLASFIRINQMELGIYMVIMPLVAAFTSDAFALFAGMLFGKHKLAPELSPKKTVEGAVGGFVGAIVCMMIYGAIMQFGFQLQANYLLLALYGAAGSAISQLGDLSFSYIKRQYKIKDYGNILPGHGGILDRFDSVILCAPLIELLIIFLPALAL